MSSTFQPRVYQCADAMEYVGGKLNFKRLLHAGWIKPIAGKAKGMDYDVRSLDLAIDKATLNGWPPLPPGTKERDQA